MFARVDVEVTVSGNEVTFGFPTPVSIIVLFVSREGGGTVWQVMAAAMKPIPAGAMSVTSSVPVSEAPPALLEMARTAEENALRRMREAPISTFLSEVRYRVVPAGCTEKAPAVALEPGEYELSVVTSVGEGAVRFRVAAA
jgi:hypothetical protein